MEECAAHHDEVCAGYQMNWPRPKPNWPRQKQRCREGDFIICSCMRISFEWTLILCHCARLESADIQEGTRD